MSGFKKTISLKRGTALAIAMIIGSGLLGLPGLVLETGNPYEAVLGWLLITLAVLPLIEIFATLGLKFPSTAGLARYAKEAVGPWGEYAVTYLVVGSLLGLPAIALIGAEYMQHLFCVPFYCTSSLAVILVTVITLFNLAGIRAISIVNYAAVAVLLLVLLFLIFFNLNFLISGIGLTSAALSGRGSVEFQKLWEIAALLFWAFLGWGSFSFSLGELEAPEKNVPRVYWLSFAIVAFIYLMLAFTTAGAAAEGVFLEGAAGLSGLAELVPGGKLLLWLMVIVLVANASSWNFTASRLLYAGAIGGALPPFLKNVSKKGVPIPALLTLYVVFLILLFATYFFEIPISTLILLVDQNFIVLYGFVVLSYWKIETGRKRWGFTGLSLVSLSFLVSGFSWWIMYPVALVGLGYLSYRKKEG